MKNLKKKLDELLPTLVSPISSPDVNAPSPSPDSDIELPGDETQATNPSGIIDVAPPALYGSYTHEYDPTPVPAPEMVQGNESADFTNNFPSFMGGNVDFGNMVRWSDNPISWCCCAKLKGLEILYRYERIRQIVHIVSLAFRETCSTIGPLHPLECLNSTMTL